MQFCSAIAQFLGFDQAMLQSLTERTSSKPIRHLTLDSRAVGLNDAFIAIQGGQSHGLDFLAQVLVKKVALIISDRCLTAEEQIILEFSGAECPVWVAPDLKNRMGDLANWFYGFPSQHIKVIGITGTNGKTSTAFYTAQLLQQLGQIPALMGTLGNGLYGQLQATLNTTPDAISVHRLLAEFGALGAQWVVMEVSSHALELGRVQGVQFQTVALTQVSRDHLDFHGTETLYQRAKMKLFTDYPSFSQVLNLDDTVGLEVALTDVKSTRTTKFGYSLRGGEPLAIKPQLVCSAFELHPDGMRLQLRLEDKVSATALHTDALRLGLMGAFNVENVLCALSILLVNGFETSKLLHYLPELQSVDGRMQRISLHPTVVVDFAHTADALAQVLIAVKQHLSGHPESSLWVIFGCGGNRDVGKRPLMGAVAEQHADKVMLTNDNPRFESPQAIIDQILVGFKQPQRVDIEMDRRLAITKVLKQAKPQDVIVIAGKGHEDYQDVRGIKTPFSDQAVVAAILADV